MDPNKKELPISLQIKTQSVLTLRIESIRMSFNKSYLSLIPSIIVRGQMKIIKKKYREDSILIMLMNNLLVQSKSLKKENLTTMMKKLKDNNNIKSMYSNIIQMEINQIQEVN